MKYLSEYMEEEQTALFKKTQAFFAFSQEQLKEGKKENNIKEGETLTSCGNGMICPKKNVDTLLKGLNDIYKRSIKKDIAENGLNMIIRRELNNYEAYYSGCIEDTVDALGDYPVTREQIQKVKNNKNYKVEAVAIVATVATA